MNAKIVAITMYDFEAFRRLAKDLYGIDISVAIADVNVKNKENPSCMNCGKNLFYTIHARGVPNFCPNCGIQLEWPTSYLQYLTDENSTLQTGV